jgi:hypothetical protein
MARSRTGLWWNIARNVGYHLALRNFGDVGFNPEAGAPFRQWPADMGSEPAAEEARM